MDKVSNSQAKGNRMKLQGRILIGVALFAFLCSATAQAEQGRGPWKTPLLSHLVDVNDVKFHQRMLQRIARLHDNNRAAGTVGYDRDVPKTSAIKH
jgi:hypothetical protein